MTRTQQQRLRKQRQRRQTLFLAVGCSAVLGLVFLVFSLTSGRYPGEGGNETAAAETAGAVAEAPAVSLQGVERPVDLSLSLGLGGNVAFPPSSADAFRAAGYGSAWEGVRPFMAGHDLNVVNLEGPLCRGGNANPEQTSLCLRGDVSSAAPMAAAGVSAVSLANDHAMDYGPKGLEETLNLLRGERLGVCGAGSNRHAAGQPLVLKTPGGAEVALLSLSDVGPDAYAAGDDSPGINAVTSLEAVGEAVSAAAGEAHYVVVLVHWGEEDGAEITPRQREIARACARAGADLVVGCHPHAVQGMEIIEDTPVIYSLGDLLYYARGGAGAGILASCRFDDGALRSLEFFPVRAGENGAAMPSGEEARRSLEELTAASPGVDLRISDGGDSALLILE